MDKTCVHPEGSENTENDYYVYTPVNPKAEESFPLVIVNHGSGANARVCESFGWIELAGKNRFMLVMAENTEPEYLHGIIQEITASYPVDTSRVYMTGTSLGAYRTKAYAGMYPNEVAAIAPMNASFGFLDGVDGDAALLKSMKMPMLFVAGTADVYHMLPVMNQANPQRGSIAAWNVLVEMQGFPEYTITEEESRQLLESTTDLLEYYTGLRLSQAIVHNYVNNRTFEINFTADDGPSLLSLIVEENGSHEPLGYDAEFAWNFFAHFSRDTQTGTLFIH